MLCIIGAPGHSTEFLFQIVQGIHLKNQRDLFREKNEETKLLTQDEAYDSVSFLGRGEGPFSNSTPDYEVKTSQKSWH